MNSQDYSNQHSEYEQTEGHGAGRFMYFLIGGMVGAGTALLFAPQKGTQTRALIARKTHEGTDYLRHKGQEIKEQAGTYADRGLRAMDQGMQAVQEGKDRVAQAVSVGREAYKRDQPMPEQKNRGDSTTGAARGPYGQEKAV